MMADSNAHRFSAATLAGGTVVALCYVVELIWGVTVPGPAQVGFSTVLTPLVSWALPDSLEE